MESSRRYPLPFPPPPLPKFIRVPRRLYNENYIHTRHDPSPPPGNSIFWRSDRDRRDRSRSFHSLGHTRSSGAATRDASWIFICGDANAAPVNVEINGPGARGEMSFRRRVAKKRLMT